MVTNFAYIVVIGCVIVVQLSILCTESSIIPTIIRRSILECIDDASEFNSVLSPLLCLLSTLLRPQPPKAASEHVRAILNSARKAASLCQPSLSVRSDASNRNVPVQNGKDTRGVKTPTTRVSKTSLNVGIAEEVSTAVMNLVYMNILFSGEDSILSGNQLASVNMHTTSQASDDCSAVNGRNRHYASSAGNAVLATLMSQRDKQRSAAEKSGVAATLAIRSSRGMNGDLGISSANRAKLPVIEHARLFGESSTVKIGHSGGSEIGKLFAENQVAYNSIEAHLADTNSLYEEGCGKLSKDLELCALMKCDLTAKKEELLRQLKQVEGEEVKLKAKAEGLHAQLENEATEQAKNLTVLQAQLEERKEIMQVASACKTVEGAFGIFQSTLFDIDAVTESKQDKSVESFLSIVRNYLATEVECMQLLQERSSTLRSKMPQLVRSSVAPNVLYRRVLCLETLIC